MIDPADFTPASGWPCATNSVDAPSIVDILSAPTAAQLLPQVLALCPRGAAWGTDEAGDGQGASPVQRQVWTAIAAWSAASYATDFELASQSLPSLITYSLADWEAEYGLPDPCLTASPVTEERIQAVRAKFAAVGAASADYAVCLAESIGYPVLIEECDAARAGISRAGDKARGAAWGDAWKVHAPATTIVPARAGISRAGDRLATWGNAPLECEMRATAQPQTLPIFAYDLVVGSPGLGEFGLDKSPLL